MFGLRRLWGSKHRAQDQAAKSPAISPELSDQATEVCHERLANLDVRRSVLDWRDRHLENTELQLRRELLTLFGSIDKQLEKMTIAETFFHEKKFSKENIEPIYLAWVEREATKIINDAQKDLRSIFSHALDFEIDETTLEQSETSGRYTDAAIAAAATGAGMAAIPVFAGMSMVSAGGVLGFIGITTISWPIAALGITTVGGLLAVGGYKSADLKSKASSRYRDKVFAFINDQVLGGVNSETSVSQNIQAHIKKATTTILAEIDA